MDDGPIILKFPKPPSRKAAHSGKGLPAPVQIPFFARIMARQHEQPKLANSQLYQLHDSILRRITNIRHNKQQNHFIAHVVGAPKTEIVTFAAGDEMYLADFDVQGKTLDEVRRVVAQAHAAVDLRNSA
jgi:hypothetical protein